MAGLVCLTTAPGAHAEDPGEAVFRMVVEKVEDLLVSPCTYNLPGDRVGYSGAFAYTTLGLGVHVAHDDSYGAVGVFEGGVYEHHGGVRYLVFTILTGTSTRADWCQEVVAPPALIPDGPAG